MPDVVTSKDQSMSHPQKLGKHIKEIFHILSPNKCG